MIMTKKEHKKNILATIDSDKFAHHHDLDHNHHHDTKVVPRGGQHDHDHHHHDHLNDHNVKVVPGGGHPWSLQPFGCGHKGSKITMPVDIVDTEGRTIMK